MILETRHSIPEILSRQALFRVLGGMDLVRLAESTREFRIDRNELLFQKGEAALGMHIVVTGQIKLYLPSEAGAEKVVHMAGPGETFGEECIFLDKAYPVAAEASKDSIVLVLERGALLAMLDNNPALARTMMARLCLRFCALVENMESCVQRSSAQRVAHFLAQQAPGDVDRFEIHLEANKQTIASQLNLAPETFSRVLGRLAKAGHILVHGRRITVVDRSALSGYATG